MSKLKLAFINLHLFDGAAAGGEGGAAGSEGAATMSSADNGNGLSPEDNAKAEQIMAEISSQNRRTAKKGEKQKVVYGTPNTIAPDAEVQSSEPEPKEQTPEEIDAEFEELIKTKYKDQFARRTQGIIDKRFKGTKQMESKLAEQGEVMSLLGAKYGVDARDTKALIEAMNEDDSYWENGADEMGMTIPAYKQYMKMKQENDRVQEQQRNWYEEQRARQDVARWMQQADAVKQSYPDFDMRTELRNGDFQQLLRSGVPVQRAYEVCHMNDIKNGVAQQAAQTAEQKTVNNIRNRAARPVENGTSNNSAAIIKNDVNSFTDADIMEIMRLTSLGKEITL